LGTGKLFSNAFDIISNIGGVVLMLETIGLISCFKYAKVIEEKTLVG
jgi:hypothetical protein